MPHDCAGQLIDVVPIVMRHVRGELRRRTLKGLTVPQFRTMSYLERRPGASLSDLADYLILTPPTVSKIVQNLVVQEVVERLISPDRRRVRLALTDKGIKSLNQARSETQQQIAHRLESLSGDELSHVSTALEVLGRVFSTGESGVDIH